MENIKWEKIEDRINSTSDRLKVPGGWLVRVTHDYSPCGPGAATAVSVTFISDPNHEWE